MLLYLQRKKCYKTVLLHSHCTYSSCQKKEKKTTENYNGKFQGVKHNTSVDLNQTIVVATIYNLTLYQQKSASSPPNGFPLRGSNQNGQASLLVYHLSVQHNLHYLRGISLQRSGNGFRPFSEPQLAQLGCHEDQSHINGHRK